MGYRKRVWGGGRIYPDLDVEIRLLLEYAEKDQTHSSRPSLISSNKRRRK